MPLSMADVHALGRHAQYPRERCLNCLLERRAALCRSILAADDLRKRDMLREVQARIERIEGGTHG